MLDDLDDTDEFLQGDDEPSHGLGEAPPHKDGGGVVPPLPSPPLCPTGASALTLPDSRLFVVALIVVVIVCSLLWGYIERDVTKDSVSTPKQSRFASRSDYYGTSDAAPPTMDEKSEAHVDYYGNDEEEQPAVTPSLTVTPPSSAVPPASDYYGPQ